MKAQEVKFRNREGNSLSAVLELPPNMHPHNYAVFAHCFTCGKDYSSIYNISRMLALNGIGVLRFDFTGVGESGGDFSETGFSSNVDDIVSASEYLQREHKAPTILVGHSLGGTAALVAASQIDGIKAVVSIAAPYSVSHLADFLRKSIDEAKRVGQSRITIGGKSFSIKRQFAEDIESSKADDSIARMNAALLVMHSPLDNIVGIDNAAQIYKAARHPKSFISLDGADHLLSKSEDSLYTGNLIAAWVKRYIELPAGKPLSSALKIVSRTGERGYTTEIQAGEHGLMADEPESAGGNDFGPNPYDLLLAALGSCTGMTLRMYADRKGWLLREIKVHLQHSKVHAEDCRECDTNKGKIDQIERVIEIDGDLDDAQRERMLQIADMCPVHRTLHSEINVKTKLR